MLLNNCTRKMRMEKDIFLKREMHVNLLQSTRAHVQSMRDQREWSGVAGKTELSYGASVEIGKSCCTQPGIIHHLLSLKGPMRPTRAVISGQCFSYDPKFPLTSLNCVSELDPEEVGKTKLLVACCYRIC